MGYTARFVPHQALYAKEQLCCNTDLFLFHGRKNGFFKETPIHIHFKETSSSLDEDGL